MVKLNNFIHRDKNVPIDGDKNVPIDGDKNDTISIYMNTTKENNTSDDDDRVREAEKISSEKVPKKKGQDEINLDIEKTNTRGQKIKVTQSEIFRHFIGKPYSTDIIKQAIKRTQTAQGSINNILKYLSMVCDEIGRQNAKESIPKKLTPKAKYAPVPERVIVPRVKPTLSWDQAMEEIKQRKQNKRK